LKGFFGIVWTRPDPWSRINKTFERMFWILFLNMLSIVRMQQNSGCSEDEEEKEEKESRKLNCGGS